MLKINLTNIESLIFRNHNAKILLADLRPIFDKWLLSYRVPALSNMRKQAMIDLLNSLDGSHIEKLARLFEDIVIVENIDHHTVKNLEFSIQDSIESELTSYASYNIMSVTRSADKVSITLVR